MAQTVLVIEDDPVVRESVRSVLQDEGYSVVTAADGRSGLDAALAEDPDAVVLDVMLPELDGFEVCRQLRRTSSAAIVMLTGRSESEDVVTGLELGADDYVTKPFEGAELAARVRAVLRRVDGTPSATTIRDLHVDDAAFRAVKGDEELALTTTEMRLLSELVRHAGTALPREVLLERVWGYGYLGDSRLVDMAIKRLRDKLGDPPAPPPYIATVRGIGYRFDRGE